MQEYLAAFNTFIYEHIQTITIDLPGRIWLLFQCPATGNDKADE
jgi:hypothetical protein